MIEKAHHLLDQKVSEFADKASQIVEALKAHLPLILQDRPVLLAYAYGSVAAGCLTPFSDVDVALVLSDEGLTPREQLRLQLQLSVELADAGIAEADVRIINQAPLAIRGQVACQGILLYSGDEAARVEFETRTRDEYFDYQPIARRLREAYFADLQQRGLYGQQREG